MTHTPTQDNKSKIKFEQNVTDLNQNGLSQNGYGLPPAVQQEGASRAGPARAAEQCLRVVGYGAEGACVRPRSAGIFESGGDALVETLLDDHAPLTGNDDRTSAAAQSSLSTGNRAMSYSASQVDSAFDQANPV